ncbi:MAG: cation:proton antiporter [Spirochaetes bacterium]|uniref:Cation:proton antiporter n=1 Tax=Candidatus Avitreponema avistercoris TaxID=2840705 RepID=A0A9D9EKK8_9SPIR|nr:cation:proton antiporter [Candidatus Avitreponema avistercoris]
MDFLHSVSSFFARFDFSRLGTGNAVLLFGLILFLGSCGGFLFKKLRLPQVVGYIVTGLLCGLSGARLFGAEALQALEPVSSLALALIGFLVGAELKAGVVKKYGRQFVGILVLESVVPFFTVGISITLVSWLLTGNFPLSVSQGLVLGAISAATAPAATTDVLRENRTKGPLTTILLGVVAMDDAVALFLFAVASSVVSGLTGAAEVSFSAQLFSILYRLVFSAGGGALAGFLLTRILCVVKNDDSRALCFALGCVMAASGAASFFGLDTILTAMACGCVVANSSPFPAARFFRLVERFTPPVYTLFFVLVGADLDLHLVTPLFAVLALVYVAARTSGKSVGATLGAKITGAPATVRKYLKWCLLSQAGVAIGLSISASHMFAGSELGRTVPLIITATTFIVQLVGPVCVKHGVTRAGETGLDITEEDLLRESTAGDVLAAFPGDKPECMVLDTAPFPVVVEAFAHRTSLNCPVSDITGKLCGVITIEHLKEVIALGAVLSDSLLACDIMDPAPVVCLPDTPVARVREMFVTYQVESIPVVSSSGKFSGLLEPNMIEKFFHKKVLELSAKVLELENA